MELHKSSTNKSLDNPLQYLLPSLFSKLDMVIDCVHIRFKQCFVLVAASAQPGQSLTYANGVSTQSTILNSAFQPASTVHFLADSRNPGSFLVRNPYVIPRNDSTEPTYEMESPELYKELYYRSLTQLQLPNRYGPDEKSSLAPELYLNRFYAVGGTDPPRESKTTTSNDLVYQQL